MKLNVPLKNYLNNLKTKDKIMKQTAVEWLLENSHIVPKNELNKRELIEVAKEMEKEQQGYSEEDMKLSYEAGKKRGNSGYSNTDNFRQPNFEEFIEQFKNK
jgi:hypothetical protein